MERAFIHVRERSKKADERFEERLRHPFYLSVIERNETKGEEKKNEDEAGDGENRTPPVDYFDITCIVFFREINRHIGIIDFLMNAMEKTGRGGPAMINPSGLKSLMTSHLAFDFFFRR